MPHDETRLARIEAQAWLVGGAVRDALLGLPVSDRDWVVVGTTPQQMLDAGFRPVGADFPVFLHPETQEEFALARTERKTGPGYAGFAVYSAPDVTLEQDLARRDLSINAIALHPATGELVDPFGGRADLAARRLRHVSNAFREDPVRLLRLARFAARWPDFSVADDTQALLVQMVQAGEVDALVAERVWQELARGLMEPRPSRMFELLRGCGALQVLMPELARLWGVPQPPEHHPEVDTGLHLMLVLDMAAGLAAPLAVRWACLCHDLGKGTTPPEQWPRHIAHEARSVALARALGQRLRVPNDCQAVAEAAAREHGNVHRSASLNPEALMRLLERCDALRRPERFAQMLLACECDARGRTGFEDAPYPQRPRLLHALAAAQAVDAQAAAAQAQERGLAGPAVGEAVRRARVAGVATALPTSTSPAASPAG